MAELETQILVAQRVKYVSEPDAATLLRQIDELSRILAGLVNSLKES